MAAVNGTLYAIFSTTATSTSTATASGDKIYSCKSATWNVDIDLPDVSTKESGGWAQHIGGLKSWNVSFDGVWDEAGSASALTAKEIMDLIIAGNVKRKFAFIPAALGTSIPGWMGMGSFKSMSVTADMEQGCTFSGSAQGDGAPAVFTA
jgi:predicted secreted protein